MYFNLEQVLSALKMDIFSYLPEAVSLQSNLRQNQASLSEVHVLKKLHVYQFSLQKKQFVRINPEDINTLNLLKNEPLKRLESDSRKVNQSTFFLAIKGERFDGNTFLKQVYAEGVSFALGNLPFTSLYPDFILGEFQKESSDSQYYVEVNDSVLALGKLAAYFRRQQSFQVLTVTGSVGKTSVREMLAAALAPLGKVSKTKGNLNNEIGATQTLLNALPDSAFVVLELGMDKPKDLAYLAPLMQADAVFLTQIGHSHMEHFESVEELAKAKTEILSGLKAGGSVFVQGQDEQVLNMVSTVFTQYAQAKKIHLVSCIDEAEQPVEQVAGLQRAFYLLKTAQVHSLYVGLWKQEPQGTAQTMQFIKFDRQAERIEKTVLVPQMRLKHLLGKHHYANACFALAYVDQMYSSEAQDTVFWNAVIEGLQHYEVVGSRQKWQQVAGYHLLDDSYNASLSSFQSAFDSFFQMKASVHSEARSIGVFGGILELGKFSKNIHQTLGEKIFEKDFDLIFLLGQESLWIEEVLLEKGYPPSKIFRTTDREILQKKLFECLKIGDFILFKGSNGFKLFQICENLVKYLDESKKY